MIDSKVTLSLFEEKIKLEGPSSPALEVLAYRMDGNPMARSSKKNKKPMAYYADLGTPSCCDYLFIKKTKTSAVLIEDTCMGKQFQHIKLKLKDLEEELKEDKIFRAKTVLRQENSLKVYGALLILCRLAQNHEAVAKELKKYKSYDFWLVINDEDDVKAIDDEGIKGIINFLEEELPKFLSGHLKGAKLIKTVQILFASELKEKLQQKEGA